MNRGRGDGLVGLRTVLAGVVAVDLVSFFFFLGDARATALANGFAVSAFADVFSQTAVRGLVVLAGVVGAVAFGHRPGRLGAGALALVSLMLLSTAHTQLFGSPWRHLFYSGMCLTGWLTGLAVSRRRGAPADESYARIGSLALLGAAYLNAGLSKIVFGGIDWASGAPIQAVIIGQDGLVADGILSIYRSWVVDTPEVARLFSVATLAFELAAPLMIAGRRTRLLVAVGLFSMHANIYVLTGILYWESMVFLLSFGLSSDPRRTAPVSEPTAPLQFHDRRFTGSAALLAACAVLAIVHQGRRASLQAEIPTANEAPATSVVPPTLPRRPTPIVSSSPPPAATRLIGPFAVGQTLADGWSIESLTMSAEGFVATLSGQQGRAAFEVTCADSEHRSPFDLGAAHIFYSSRLEFHDLEAVGRAVQAQVHNAAGQDVCSRLADWRKAAQAGEVDAPHSPH